MGTNAFDSDDDGLYSFETFGKKSGDLSRSHVYVLVADPRTGLEIKQIGRRRFITRKSARRWWASLPTGVGAEPSPLAEARQRANERARQAEAEASTNS
jgi:hypothetical protein